jgi:hypothetical protein
MTPDLAPGTRVRASPDGLASFPDLRHRCGTVEWCRGNATRVVWDDRAVTTIMATMFLEAAR